MVHPGFCKMLSFMHDQFGMRPLAAVWSGRFRLDVLTQSRHRPTPQIWLFSFGTPSRGPPDRPSGAPGPAPRRRPRHRHITLASFQCHMLNHIEGLGQASDSNSLGHGSTSSLRVSHETLEYPLLAPDINYDKSPISRFVIDIIFNQSFYPALPR